MKSMLEWQETEIFDCWKKKGYDPVHHCYRNIFLQDEYLNRGNTIKHDSLCPQRFPRPDGDGTNHCTAGCTWPLNCAPV